jgi:hypothetical protein
VEYSEISPYNYSHMFLKKDAKNIHWKKRQLLQQLMLGKPDNPMKKTETRSPSLTLSKNQFKKD